MSRVGASEPRAFRPVACRKAVARRVPRGRPQEPATTKNRVSGPTAAHFLHGCRNKPPRAGSRPATTFVTNGNRNRQERTNAQPPPHLGGVVPNCADTRSAHHIAVGRPSHLNVFPDRAVAPASNAPRIQIAAGALHHLNVFPDRAVAPSFNAPPFRSSPAHFTIYASSRTAR